ncbi:MAG TPA: penicillin acylase family protein [Bryobacteraceae bacterium]|nr:penicillin acylase family protein [Bryobacteraceae bacterium]
MPDIVPRDLALVYNAAMLRGLLILLLLAPFAGAADIQIRGLKEPVEVLRDRWGVPHIYARNTEDLFFTQGYLAARDRLWQIDLWRRVGTGKLAEALGPTALPRDGLAWAVRYRGNWSAEWESYGPGARDIAVSFTSGINAYIRELGGKRLLEFRIAGYDPGLWEPEDCLARMAGILMTRNVQREVRRVEDARQFGLKTLQHFLPPDPFIPLRIPNGLDLDDVTAEVLRVYNEAVGPVKFSQEQGSNNWVVDGTMTATGKPILANDPHRPLQIPSLRRTVHLVAPGWSLIGAGEPALPGIALGHNGKIAWGFTIVGIDQQDLYVERLHPSDPNRYLYRGEWRAIEVERVRIPVRGETESAAVELKHTIHGPIIQEDPQRRRAYALRWVGSEPGTAGYFAGLAVARASTWNEFLDAMERWKVPSENIVYADAAGNIGWQAAGLTPIRTNWSGLFPVPGHTGEYEWSGFRRVAELPRKFNPPSHFIATANHNILPSDYRIPIGYEWALPYRYERILELISGGNKFSVADFQRFQQDIVSVPARRFQKVLQKWNPPTGSEAGEIREQLLRWDAAMAVDSVPAAIYAVWISKLPAELFGPALGARTDLAMLLKTLEARSEPNALQRSLGAALKELQSRLGPDRKQWRWGRLHQLHFRHDLNRAAFHCGPFERPGDAQTVNAASGTDFRQANGASYRQIIDLGDWDRSVMTNVPGESGNPENPRYSDQLDGWLAGRYHPMLFSRKAVEAATIERMTLVPEE